MKEAEILVQGQTCTKFCIKSDFGNTQIFKDNGMLKCLLTHDINE